MGSGIMMSLAAGTLQMNSKQQCLWPIGLLGDRSEAGL